MTDLILLEERKDVRLSGAANPTTSTVASIKDTYQVTTPPFELFTCVNIDGGDHEWVGSQGTKVTSIPAILSPNHADLLAMYTMEDISGSTLVDESLASNDATLLDVTTEAGKIGSTAIVGNGTSAYGSLDLTTADIETSFTFTCWVKFNGTISTSTFLSKRSGGNSFQLYMNGVLLSALMWGASPTTSSKSFSASTGVWYFIALSWDGTDIILRVDGSEQSTALTGTLDTTVDATRFMEDWHGNEADISMDQIRIFKRGLTTLELDSVYEEGTP